MRETRGASYSYPGCTFTTKSLHKTKHTKANKYQFHPSHINHPCSISVPLLFRNQFSSCVCDCFPSLEEDGVGFHLVCFNLVCFADCLRFERGRQTATQTPKFKNQLSCAKFSSLQHSPTLHSSFVTAQSSIIHQTFLIPSSCSCFAVRCSCCFHSPLLPFHVEACFLSFHPERCLVCFSFNLSDDHDSGRS